MRIHIELTVEAINNFDSRTVKGSNPKPSDGNLIAEKTGKSRPPVVKNARLPNRLSMYTVTASFRRDLHWKKAVECLAKKKFNVKSRYKTAAFKHRPPQEKPHIVSLPSRNNLFPKRSSGLLKPTPLATPVREDEIRTMVEVDSCLQVPNNSKERLSHEDIAARLLQLVRDKDRGGGADANDDAGTVDDESVKRAVEVLRRCLGENWGDGDALLGAVLREVERKREEERCRLEFVERQTKSGSDVSRKSRKEPVITISGAKNAKLICIRDDSSVIENAEEPRVDKEMMTEKEIELASSATQTDLRAEKQNPYKAKSTVKISRLPKTTKKVLELLPKPYAINIIQYKLEYHRYCKQNPMYRKSASVQPWVLTGRVADDILDHALQSVVGELEVNEYLENMYRAEFEY